MSAAVALGDVDGGGHRAAHAVDELPERVGALPGMGRLLPALRDLPPLFLVGGGVRDALLGADVVDLDLAVEADAAVVAGELARRLGGEVRAHERFGTATVRAPGLAFDLARTRRERYPHPGALPEVEPARLEDDLVRRDFTVNAMAVALGPGEVGRLVDPHGGVADLDGGLIRVLHPMSFLDDPTRLLRAVRYATRLGFRLEPTTEGRAREAAAAGAFATVSGARIRDEVLDLLGERPAPGEGVALLAALGLGAVIDPALATALATDGPGALADRADAAAAGADAVGADRSLAVLAALLVGAGSVLRPFVDRLDLGRERRERVIQAALLGPELGARLQGELRASELHALLAGRPPEVLAVALAHGAPSATVRHFLAELQRVALEITGADLVAAGVPGSPALGRALRETLRRKLDGEVAGRDAELATALGLVRGGRP